MLLARFILCSLVAHTYSNGIALLSFYFFHLLLIVSIEIYSISPVQKLVPPKSSSTAFQFDNDIL